MGGWVPMSYHLLATLLPPDWLCIKAGSCVRHFDDTLIVWAKSRDSVDNPQSFKRKESRSGSNRGPSAYQHSALPLGHTGSRQNSHLSPIYSVWTGVVSARPYVTSDAVIATRRVEQSDRPYVTWSTRLERFPTRPTLPFTLAHRMKRIQKWVYIYNDYQMTATKT